MKTVALWDDRFGDYLADSTDKDNGLRNVADIVDVFDTHGVKLCISDPKMCYTEKFSMFLWGRAGLKPESRDDLLLLGKALERATIIGKETMDDCREIVGCLSRDDNLIMMVSDNPDNNLCVKNLEEYYGCRRFMLGELVKEDEFYDALKVSFIKLYFHNEISRSIKSLKNPFDKMRSMISEHLEKIEQEYNLFRNRQSVGYVNLAKLFQEKTGIECSTQAGREGIENLKFIFKDEKGEDEEIVCELHTKLKFKDMNYKEQDRIYFHPPIEGVENKRILIAHIGKHL